MRSHAIVATVITLVVIVIIVWTSAPPIKSFELTERAKPERFVFENIHTNFRTNYHMITDTQTGREYLSNDLGGFICLTPDSQFPYNTTK